MLKRLVNCTFSDSVCNLRCNYCYIGQLNQHVKKSSKLNHSPEEIKVALSAKRLGGTCHMSLCALGETLLVEDIIEIAKGLMDEGHVVSIVTNGTISKKIDELTLLSEKYCSRLFIKFSFHYVQLVEKKQLEQFWENVKKISDAKISYTVELVADDENLQYIDEIKKECMQNVGALCHVIEARTQDGKNWPRLTQDNLEQHQMKWGEFKSELFEFQQRIWGVKIEDFCYAGDWIFSVDLKSGNVTPCFAGGMIIDNIYNDINSDIKFNAIGNKCNWGTCFAAHVLLAHGVVPGFDSPTYFKERNRYDVIHEKEWVSASYVHEMFDDRLCKNNEIYSDNRKANTNFVMGVIYSNVKSEDVIRFEKIAKAFCDKNKDKRMAIYGAGKVGTALAERILQYKNDIVFIDQNSSLQNNKIIPVKALDEIEKIDIIVNSVYREHYDISNIINQKNSRAEIINVLDLYKWC